jgi:hypothetical protein
LAIIARRQNKILKQLFHIEQNKPLSGQAVLSFRLGERHCCFAITDKTGSELYELAYCSTVNWNEKELAGLLSVYPSLQGSFYETQLAYDFPQAVLVPSSGSGAEQTAQLVNDGNHAGAHIITEQVPGWQINAVYAVPNDIQQWFSQRFPTAKYRHQYSLGIKTIQSSGDAGCLLVDFREDEFSVIAARSGSILLARCFEYSTPDDVLYYLLKLCRQFQLSQQELQLSISGLIDRQSSLFKELYQYFIHTGFRDASWSRDNRAEFPAHFFTSLNDLAQCAS